MQHLRKTLIWSSPGHVLGIHTACFRRFDIKSPLTETSTGYYRLLLKDTRHRHFVIWKGVLTWFCYKYDLWKVYMFLINKNEYTVILVWDTEGQYQKEQKSGLEQRLWQKPVTDEKTTTIHKTTKMFHLSLNNLRAF